MCAIGFSRRHAISFLVLCVGLWSFPATSAGEASLIEYQDYFAYDHVVSTMNISHLKEKEIVNAELSSFFTASREIALIQLDRSSSVGALRGLAYLHLIKLDGAVSRDHVCAVLRKGKVILPYLEEARKAAIAGRCAREGSSEVPNRMICTDINDAMKKIDRSIEAIKGQGKCQ